MSNLNVVDYTLIISYFIVLLGLGFYLRARANKSMEDYFLAGRSLPWWALGLSGTAAWFSVSGTMVIIAFLYMLGPRGLYIEFRGGACLLMIIPLLWSGRWHRRSQCITGAQFMIFRFGKTFGGNYARLASAFGAIICTVAMLAMLIKGIGLFFSMFFNLSPEWCAIIMVGIATIYTVLSGFYGVVYTDVFQSSIILVVVIIISVMAFIKVPDAASIAHVSELVTGGSEWMRSSPQWRMALPSEGGFGQYLGQYEYLLLFAVFYLLRNLLVGTGAGNAPMYYGARNDRECGKLTFLWGNLMMFRWPMMMGFAVLGIYLVNDLFTGTSQLADVAVLIKSQFDGIEKVEWASKLANIAQHPEAYSQNFIDSIQRLMGDNWGQKLQLLGFEGNIDPERILPAVVLFCLPTGLKGVIIVTLIAAFMSTFDTSVNTAAAYFAKDLYQGFIHPKAGHRELMWVSWISSIMLVVAGFIMGYMTKSINDIWGWIIMGLGGGVVPGILIFYWWRFSGGAFAFSTFACGITAILQRACWPDNWHVLNEWQLFVFMLVVSLITSIIGILVFKSTPKDVIENYYRTVRPFGFWKPFKGCLTDAENLTIKKDFRACMCAIPFCVLWLVSLFLWPMQLIIHNFKGMAISLVIFGIALAGMYHFWYKNLPENDAK